MSEERHNLLENIHYPSDLKKLQESDLPQVCDELRDFIIDAVASIRLILERVWV